MKVMKVMKRMKGRLTWPARLRRARCAEDARPDKTFYESTLVLSVARLPHTAWPPRRPPGQPAFMCFTAFMSFMTQAL